MFGYLLGALSAVNENQEEVDLLDVNVDRLESVLGEAKRLQNPAKFIITQEMVDEEMKDGVKYSDEVSDILTKLLRVSNLSKHEIFVLMRELKTYERENKD